MTRKLRLILFLILSLLILSFIFGNSLQSREESSARSRGIMELLWPLLDPFGRLPEDELHHFVRKLAHFTEFAALGFCLTGVALNTLWTGKKRIYLPILWSAMAAVTDETIQAFTGRACMVKDMLLDTCGAVFGVVCVWAVVRVINRHRTKSLPLGEGGARQSDG